MHKRKKHFTFGAGNSPNSIFRVIKNKIIFGCLQQSLKPCKADMQ